jgi:predicted RNA-binding protein
MKRIEMSSHKKRRLPKAVKLSTWNIPEKTCNNIYCGKFLIEYTEIEINGSHGKKTFKLCKRCLNLLQKMKNENIK